MRGTTEKGKNGKRTKLVLSGRYIPDKNESGRVYTSASFWVTKNLAIGGDYRPLADEINPTATFRAMSEDPKGWRPAAIFGTSVDDFSVDGEEIESRAVYGTLSKALPRLDALNLTVAPYAGAAYIHELEDLRLIGGVALRHEFATLMVQYSGTDTHLSLSKSLTDNIGVSAILWGMEMPGIAVRWRF